MTCSLCNERSKTKLATVYWAWYWPSGDRRSYKQRFDPICAMPTFAKLNWSIDNEGHCPVCREHTGDSPDVTLWATAYVPGHEAAAYALDYHARCFEQIADELTVGAQRLLDRPLLGAGGPPPRAEVDPWDGFEVKGVAST